MFWNKTLAQNLPSKVGGNCCIGEGRMDQSELSAAEQGAQVLNTTTDNIKEPAIEERVSPDSAEKTTRPRRRRKIQPPIDLDESIKNAQNAAKAAKKALASARSEARSERKKRARLVRKAGQLSAQDLERIAVLKRTGW